MKRIKNSEKTSWILTRRVARDMTPQRMRFLQIHWNNFRIKGKAFGYGFILASCSNANDMVYIFTEKKEKNKTYRTLVYATTMISVTGFVIGNI